MDCDSDGTDDLLAQSVDATCTYPSAGTYTIRIKDATGSGTGFPRIYFNNGGDRLKLLTIDQWGTGKWTSMNSAFYGCENLNSAATDAPDLTNVTDMDGMFSWAFAFNAPINHWDTSNVIYMYDLFRSATSFNQPLGNWNTSQVTNMIGMFGGAHAFNQDISTWDTSQVVYMMWMFSGASSFNQPIGSWTTSNVQTMNGMFQQATSFNQDISNWNTGNVTDMQYMFYYASSFNQDIGNWDTSKVTILYKTFSLATSFDQDLSNWDVSAVTFASDMFEFAQLSTANYDALLNSWSTQPLQNDVLFGGGDSTYCLGEAARQSIIDTYGWTITDGGKDCPDTTPPTASILAPVSGGSLLQPRAYLLVDATDEGVGMKEVQFSGYYGNTWHFLATDDDGSDGWGYVWPTYNITDAFVKVKAVAFDNNNNQTSIEMDNVPLTGVIITSGGYQARGGNLTGPEISEGNPEINEGISTKEHLHRRIQPYYRFSRFLKFRLY